MNCDPLARWYRWLEYAGFGRALERRRLEFLPELRTARKVLMLGEGDGRFLAALLAANRHAEVDYVDSSSRMLALARQRSSASESNAEQWPAAEAADARVRYHFADAATWLRACPAGDYDAVCTHFFLDCFTTAQLESLVPEIARHCGGSAAWIVSEFRVPKRGWLRTAARLLITLMYALFRVVTGLRVGKLPDHARVLTEAGFRRVQHVVAAGGILESERWLRA